jgi:hypothetical protein
MVLKIKDFAILIIFSHAGVLTGDQFLPKYFYLWCKCIFSSLLEDISENKLSFEGKILGVYAFKGTDKP